MLVMVGVALGVIVADECYRAYKRRKVRKGRERELGVHLLSRRERKEWRKRERQEMRARERLLREAGLATNVRPGHGAVRSGRGVARRQEDGEDDELPEYSARPRSGQEQIIMAGAPRNRRGRRSTGRAHSEHVAQREEEERRDRKKKRKWFKRKKSGVSEAEVPPPSYEAVMELLEDAPESSQMASRRRAS